jgi:molecular chaperone DnaJ
VKIPAGTQSGRIFRLKGQGLPTLHNTYGVGDILVEIVVVTPTRLNREEADYYTKLKEYDSRRELKPGKSFFAKLKDYFV